MAAHIETGTMASPEQYTSKTLNHLGLIAGMYDELGIGELIDRIILQDMGKRTVSIGQAVKAMVLNGLGFVTRALYLTPQFFKDKPVETLIGKGIEAKHLNDDVLGHALDAIYTYGPENLYSQLSIAAVQKLGLLCRFGHMDTTSFHCDGQYDSKPETVEEMVIRIIKGYSRDHRPDLNQVVLQLICERQAGIPILMAVLSGNSSDKESFRNMINSHVEQMREGFKIEYIIADSALYVAKTLANMNGFMWVSRVPETLTIACDIIHSVAPDLMNNLEQAEFRSLGAVYGEVRQRWIVIYSPEAYQRALRSVNKICLEQSANECLCFERLCKQDFSCEADALSAFTKFKKRLKFTFVTDIHVSAQPHYNGKGRPVHDRAPDFYTYRIEGSMASTPHERTRRLERKSCFILATNQLDCESLSDDEIISAYKDQQKVERGFRFLKDPMFMASTLFLKSPKRIMALMMVMTLCLLVYAALEYRIRNVLNENNETFPNQNGVPTAKPTTRWTFQFFSGIHELTISQQQTIVMNMNDDHRALLRLLGSRYEELYF